MGHHVLGNRIGGLDWGRISLFTVVALFAILSIGGIYLNSSNPTIEQNTLPLNQEARSAHTMLSLIETDELGGVVRELSFELTDQPARTCLVGDWKVADVLVDASSYTHNSAYAWRGGNLELLLVNRFCDSYDSYIGRIEGESFIGEHVLYGRGSGPVIEGSTVGRVSGLYSKR